MTTSSTATNACNARVLLADVSGSVIDISGSSTKVTLGLSRQSGPYKLYADRWKYRKQCNHSVTVDLEVVYSSTSAEGFALLRDWYFGGDGAREFAYFLQDTTESYRGNFYLQDMAIELPADEARPVKVKAKLISHGQFTATDHTDITYTWTFDAGAQGWTGIVAPWAPTQPAATWQATGGYSNSLGCWKDNAVCAIQLAPTNLTLRTTSVLTFYVRVLRAPTGANGAYRVDTYYTDGTTNLNKWGTLISTNGNWYLVTLSGIFVNKKLLRIIVSSGGYFITPTQTGVDNVTLTHIDFTY
jgi:hypothetical protein